MNRTLRCACLLASLALGAGRAAAADALAPSSPFLPPAAAGAPAENTPLELRGILVDQGGYLFSIYDPVRHTGTWSRLNETGHDFVVRTHDAGRDEVTVDYQGRVLTLPLHAAKVAAAGGAPAGGGPAVGAGPTVVLNPTAADEAARFNRVKEEIARRRARREQANGPTPPQQR